MDVALCLCVLGHSVRPESASVVATLHALGIQVWLVTGDNAGTAEAVAQVRTIRWGTGALQLGYIQRCV